MLYVVIPLDDETAGRLSRVASEQGCMLEQLVGRLLAAVAPRCDAGICDALLLQAGEEPPAVELRVSTYGWKLMRDALAAGSRALEVQARVLATAEAARVDAARAEPWLDGGDREREDRHAQRSLRRARHAYPLDIRRQVARRKGTDGRPAR